MIVIEALQDLQPRFEKTRLAERLACEDLGGPMLRARERSATPQLPLHAIGYAGLGTRLLEHVDASRNRCDFMSYPCRHKEQGSERHF